MPSSSDLHSAAAVSYRDKVASTISLVSLLYQPLQASGALLRILRGKLYHKRHVRSVADAISTPANGCTAGKATSAATTPPSSLSSNVSSISIECHTSSAAVSDRALNAHKASSSSSSREGEDCMKGTWKTCLLDPSVLSSDDLLQPAVHTSTDEMAARACTPVYVLGAGVQDTEVKQALHGAVTVHHLSSKAAELLQLIHNELSNSSSSNHNISGLRTGSNAQGKRRTAFAGPIHVRLAIQNVELTYKNYTMPELLSMVLPMQEDAAVVALSGFEQVGHIAHVNLSSANLPYAPVIGQVVLDCNATVDVVVNKADAISSVFREFKMDIIAERPGVFQENGGRVRRIASSSPSASSGVALTEAEKKLMADENIAGTPMQEMRLNRMLTATVRQHGCDFRVPYNRVYWNSRLSFEHTRLVEAMHKGDVLFDVMAGVGPFAVPAAKKGVQVFANDLNPVAAQYMTVNAELNRLSPSSLHVYNLDGREFMNTIIFESVMGLTADGSALTSGQQVGRRHVTMNLPAIAVEFLDVFKPFPLKGTAVNEADLDKTTVNARWSRLPVNSTPQSIDRRVLFHVYCFSAADDLRADAIAQCETHLGYALPPTNVEHVVMVRDVAPTKRMMCVSFTLPDAFWRHLLSSADGGATPDSAAVTAPVAKKAKMDDGDE